MGRTIPIVYLINIIIKVSEKISHARTRDLYDNYLMLELEISMTILSSQRVNSEKKFFVTSIEPQEDRLLFGLMGGLKEPIEQCSSMSFIDSNIPCIVLQLHRRLPWKMGDLVCFLPSQHGRAEHPVIATGTQHCIKAYKNGGKKQKIHRIKQSHGERGPSKLCFLLYRSTSARQLLYI